MTKSYGLQYEVAKTFNNNHEYFLFLLSLTWPVFLIANGISGCAADMIKELQNMILQYASINTFIQHYSVGIHVNTQAIIRGLLPEKHLVRFACSMSTLINPQHPYKLIIK